MGEEPTSSANFTQDELREVSKIYQADTGYNTDWYKAVNKASFQIVLKYNVTMPFLNFVKKVQQGCVSLLTFGLVSTSLKIASKVNLINSF